MSTYPRIEARVSALERRQNILDARTEELSEDVTASVKQLYDDMTASFKQLVAYQVQTEQTIETRFNKIEATMATKEDITNLKNDMTTMENRILDAFKHVLDTINPQQPPSE